MLLVLLLALSVYHQPSHPPTIPSTNHLIHQPFYSPTIPSTNHPIHQPSHPPTILSTNHPIHQPSHPPTIPSTNHTIHQPYHPPTSPSTYHSIKPTQTILLNLPHHPFSTNPSTNHSILHGESQLVLEMGPLNEHFHHRRTRHHRQTHARMTFHSLEKEERGEEVLDGKRIFWMEWIKEYVRRMKKKRIK